MCGQSIGAYHCQKMLLGQSVPSFLDPFVFPGGGLTGGKIGNHSSFDLLYVISREDIERNNKTFKSDGADLLSFYMSVSALNLGMCYGISTTS